MTLDPYARFTDPDLAPLPDPGLFVSDFQDANKNLGYLLICFDYYFMKLHLH